MPPSPRGSAAHHLGCFGRAFADGHYRRAQRAAIAASASAGDEVERYHALDALGQVLRTRGCYAEAEPVLLEALAIARRIARTRQPFARLFLAAARNSLGVLYRFTGRYTDAARLYRAALPVFVATCGPRSREVAALHHNLGGIEHARRRFAQGLVHARLSSSIHKQLLGPHHPDVARDMVALAALLEGTGALTKAIACHRRALGVLERGLGRAHHEVAVACHNLATALSARGDHGEAEPLFRRALRIKHRCLGRKHPDVAITLNNLGLLCKQTGRVAEARRLYERAAAIFERALGAGHDKSRLCRENAAKLPDVDAAKLRAGPRRAPARVRR